MKNKWIYFLLIIGLLFTLSCKDEELDPILIHKIEKGSLLALRKDAVENYPCVSKFDKAKFDASDKMTFESDFLSGDLTSLKTVFVFAKLVKSGDDEDKVRRSQVKTVDGGNWTIPSGGKFPRGTIEVGLMEIFGALELHADTIASITTKDRIYIELDIELQDGTMIPQSSVVNSGLYESTQFFPAHELFYCYEENVPLLEQATSTRQVRGKKAVYRENTLDTVLMVFNKRVTAPVVKEARILTDDTVDVTGVTELPAALLGLLNTALKLKGDDAYKAKQVWYFLLTARSNEYTPSYVINAATAVAEDGGGAFKTKSFELGRVDNVGPIASYSFNKSHVKRNDKFTLTVNFSEEIQFTDSIPVVRLINVLDNSALDTVFLSKANATEGRYEFTHDMDFEGDVKIALDSVKDLAGNPMQDLFVREDVIVYDTTLPTITPAQIVIQQDTNLVNVVNISLSASESATISYVISRGVTYDTAKGKTTVTGVGDKADTINYTSVPTIVNDFRGLLRGSANYRGTVYENTFRLDVGANYYIYVVAVDLAGNETKTVVSKQFAIRED